eukprot:m.321184 g.321184  ORF g.321184 m.321184 type:complete len:104 (-) comp27593_c1_seq1:12525-12836(-)
MGDSDDDFFGDMGAVMAACEQAERILEPNKVDDISAVKTAALGQMAVDGAVETIEATPQSQVCMCQWFHLCQRHWAMARHCPPVSTPPLLVSVVPRWMAWAAG